jgi:hypothetical protein
VITPLLFLLLSAGELYADGLGGRQAISCVEARTTVAESDTLERNGMLLVGEDIEYKVSYSFFNLGRIRLQVLDKWEQDGRTIYRALCSIDSNPGIPFVDLHIRFTSEFDEEIFSYTWISADSSKEKIFYRRFTFDNDSLRAIVEQGTKPARSTYKVEKVDTFRVTDKCQDGLSLFYFARRHVRKEHQVNIPTFIDTSQVNTFINFTNKIEPIEIDAADYPVETVHFIGEANFVGVFGLSGGFTGWFSNDTARVPLLARMKVILGSVKVELERWNRAGWQPPRYRGDLAR